MQLIIDNVQKNFQDKKVLTDCSYQFEAGKIIGLLGRNGAGKTTLFNILNQTLDADQGRFYLMDQEQEKPLDINNVGMVYAENYLPDFLTGYEFVQFFIDIYGSQNRMGADDYLDMVAIDDMDRHRIIKGYSSGMQSKLSILTIFIMQPKLILLDEPLTSVDVVAGIQLKKLLKTLKNDHIIILSTHILQLATDLCDEVVLLKDGRLEKLDIDKNEADFEERVIKELEGANHV